MCVISALQYLCADEYTFCFLCFLGERRRQRLEEAERARHDENRQARHVEEEEEKDV